MNVEIRRVSRGKYKLVIDGEEIERYQTETMTHPRDWAEDAKSHGASEEYIRAYDYYDER